MRKVQVLKLGSWIVMLIAGTLILHGCGDEGQFASGTYTGLQNFGLGQISSAITIDIKQNGNRVSGSVTPPFQDKLESITNGTLDNNTIQFDRKESNFTYRYSGSIRRNGMALTITGEFEPLGCSDASSGEPCPTDSNGSFQVTKQ